MLMKFDIPAAPNEKLLELKMLGPCNQSWAKLIQKVTLIKHTAFQFFFMKFNFDIAYSFQFFENQL